MLKLTQTVYEQIKAHGQASYPYEGCGLLLGSMENGTNVATAVTPLSNVWPNNEEKWVRFRIAENDWRDAELQAMLDGLDVIGIFHSHPDNPPVASPRDLAWAAFAGYSYLITEVVSGTATHSRSWQLLTDRSGFIEEIIEIIDTKKIEVRDLGD